MISREEAEKRLKLTFGFEHFKDEQWNAIYRILNGERVLMILRTGFGKSLCYQFPATQFDGVTVIFSPLIALMRDQVNFLIEKGISAAYINSDQTPEDNLEVIEKAKSGEIKILYIAPERLENDLWNQATSEIKFSMVVIDEAHTISVWGHDFRPAFRKIINVVNLLNKRLPVLAVTATATKDVQKDIEAQIGGKITTIRGSLVRENLCLHVIHVNSEEEKRIWLAKNLNSLPGTGLIYTGTRTSTEDYAGWLNYVGIKSTLYNAGLDADRRRSIEKGLMNNDWKCIVSTNALGMGIDKRDIRFVIHTQIPASPIHYYQEIGRAGRDGKLSEIILFFNEDKDLELQNSFIENAHPSEEKYNRVLNSLSKDILTEKEVLVKCNITSNQLRTIKADLINMGIVREVLDGKRKVLEMVMNAPRFDYHSFDQQKAVKARHLNSMVEYVHTQKPRMQFLCEYLDCEDNVVYKNCDNTDAKKLCAEHDSALESKLQLYRESSFPRLNLAISLWRGIKKEDGEKYKLKMFVRYPDTYEFYRGNELIGEYYKQVAEDDFTNEEQPKFKEMLATYTSDCSHITNGAAASYYGVSNVGSVIHKCKYENGGDFPEYLVYLLYNAFLKAFGKYEYDLILYVPPTHSGDLVKHLAENFAQKAGIPISHGLKKLRETQEQKIFQNKVSKQANISDAFDIDEDVKGKNIILIDDIYDSGATVIEISQMLSKKGAKFVTPLVLAKTVGGQE